ncbi:hypothetical protein EZ313_12855 [Ramlibacter henchirensis]|uniref:Carboxypeptidase regulatory-like domain-containing protein n=2 Tax=Ramlibacter henchirensis TaxID=204072 RepID=A0A4Z0BVU3_9BURK|nr:hypothetical protein EZ313_12855 [Ramlibacter henchirensis]
MAVSVAAMVAACGGGGGGGGDSAQPGVQLSGVAATGLALANSSVDVKCASGTGTATTNASGAYTVAVVNGALPCLVKVTGTADGAEVTLHSLAEAGTASGSTTTATANVTPLTEMILAQLAGTVPTSFFESFGSGTTVTAAQLQAATTTVLAALKDATGIDLAADPFKSDLVPATATTAGNAYDDALEALKAKVPLQSLPLVVTQIASTAVTSGTTTAPLTLADVMAGVNAGGSATCPTALSGKYRVIEYTGLVQEVQIDFGRNVVIDGADEIPFTPSAQPCEFSIGSGPTATRIGFGPSGVGALQDDGTIAYLVPVQAHPLSAFTGEWNYVESGIREDDNPVHFLGKFTFAATGAGVECGYRNEDTGALSATCEQDNVLPSISATSDGGAALAYGDTPGVMYGYRAPNGNFFAFGSTNASGTGTTGSMRTHFIMHKPSPWVAPAVGAVSKYWDFAMLPTSAGLAPSSAADSSTVNSVSGNTVQRTRASDSRVDTLSLNDPLPGVRTRIGPSTLAVQHQIQLGGLGVTVTFNGEGEPHLYAASLGRP